MGRRISEGQKLYKVLPLAIEEYKRTLIVGTAFWGLGLWGLGILRLRGLHIWNRVPAKGSLTSSERDVSIVGK